MKKRMTRLAVRFSVVGLLLSGAVAQLRADPEECFNLFYECRDDCDYQLAQGWITEGEHDTCVQLCHQCFLQCYRGGSFC